VRPLDEVHGVGQQIVLDRLHPLARQRAGVLDDLLADAAETRVLGGVVHVRRPALQHPAGHEQLPDRRIIARVVRLFGLLFGVQVV
jgi:hypothetical protein